MALLCAEFDVTNKINVKKINREVFLFFVCVSRKHCGLYNQFLIVGQHKNLLKTQSYGYTEHDVFYAISNGTNHIVVPVIANKIIKLILF